KQLQELKQKLSGLKAAPEERAEPTPKAAPSAAPAAAPKPAIAASAPPAAAQAPRAVAAILDQPLPQPPRPAPPHEPSAIESAIDGFMTWLKGGNWIARSGIAILFLGAAFLAKYAADNSMFPIELRFIALSIGAFALLIVGWRLRERRALYAQLLQGGGIAGLYLTVFAATRLFQLLPTTLAFGLLAVIALAAAVLAVAQDALSLAVIGT